MIMAINVHANIWNLVVVGFMVGSLGSSVTFSISIVDSEGNGLDRAANLAFVKLYFVFTCWIFCAL